MDQASAVALATLSRGARIFYRKDASTWLPGQFVALTTEATVSIQPEKGSGVLTVALDAVLPANPVLQDGIPDVVQLSYLNEPGILYNLQHRYQADGIYTWAGPVLIALNPCKALPLYTAEIASGYKQAARECMTALPPHIYLVAAAAFRQMLRNQSSQSLVVSGESGAGKTETTKKAMQYFATLAGGTGVEDQVLETNPILEAFGNAKTLRNHNSSRFGKLIQIHFNGSHHICGATIKTYLLEKSRVAYQLHGERSFHIFYQLVRGTTAEERSAFMLPPKVQDFRFLAQSGCFDIADVDDAAEFRAVRQALLDVGIDADTQAMLFKLLSGLLWLGNIEFEESGTGDSTKVRQNPALDHAAELLGVSADALVTALTTRRIVAPGEVVIKLLKVGEALEARNSLAKAVYSSIFNWVVTRINARLGSGKATSRLYIAILDIYGFEQFDRNSFEQLCINYANERLQQQFTHHLFKLEQVEYESEGVDWTKVEFIDNQDCVDVFELMPPKGLGMLAVLDSQCKFPRATDTTLHTQLLDALASRPHFGTNPRVPGSFIIRHYAGAVQYDTNGLLDKNKDTLGADLIKLIASSSKPLLAELGAAVQEEAERSTKKGQTVITRFGQQLRELVSELDNTGLHFVRCIKPNARLAPNCLEPAAVLHQLRCCGVLEVARVAAAGFPTRYLLGAFASRYSLLLSPEEQLVLQRQQQGSADQRKVCLVLLERFGLLAGQYQLGRTKVFFRPGVLGMVEDRWARMQAAVMSVQSGWRMYRCRIAYLQLKKAAVLMQALWRARVDRLAYHELVAKHDAALVFQTAWRGHKARAHFLLVRRAVVTIQTRGYRTWRFSRWLARAMQARDRAELSAEEVRVKSKLEADWFSALRAEYSISMEDVPMALAAWRDCYSAGATTIDLVKEALTAWRNLPSPSSPRESLRAFQMPAGAVGVTGPPRAARQLPSSAPPAEYAPPTVHPVAVAALVVAPVAVVPHAPPSRPPVMVMNAANVTPAVVNRFELAQELAIQVERLNLENVKLQKQLQLERSLTQRYQHKCEEQSVNWLDQVRLLQAYIQKCRAMFGDSQLPPLPKQVAAVTQPSEAARQNGGTAGGQEEIPIAGAAMGGAMSAARATLTQDAAAAPPCAAAASERAQVAADAITPGSVSAACASLEQDGVAAALGLVSASARVTGAAPAQGSPVALPSVGAAITGTAAAAAAAVRSPFPNSVLCTAQYDLVPSTSSATQTDPVPEARCAPEPAAVLVPEPPPPLVTSCTATQTPPPPQAPDTAAIGTETEPEKTPQPPEAHDAGADGQGVAGPLQQEFLTAAVPSGSPNGEQPIPAETSSPVSLHSGSVSIEPGPSSSAGGQQVSTNNSMLHLQQQAGASSSVPCRGGGAAVPPANASQRYVTKLGEELDKVMQVLPDDVTFIREVQEGQLVAPDMDPGVELFKLKKKFDVWKREFKEKLRTTEEVLRKIEHMESRPTPGQQGSDTLRPSQSLRVSGLAAGAPGAGGRSAGGPPETAQRPGHQDAHVTKRRTGSSSKLLNKLFSSGAR